MLYYYAKCRILFTIMLNVDMLSVVMLSVVMLNVVMLCCSALYLQVKQGAPPWY